MTPTSHGLWHRVHPRSGDDLAAAPRQAAEELLPRPAPGASPRALHRARCSCQCCGAHTYTNVGYTIGGNCPNCGSFDLVPIADR